MKYTLNHPVCVLRIADDIDELFEEKEYRSPLFTVLLTETQRSTLLLNGAEHIVEGKHMFFLTPYQPLMFADKLPDTCLAIQFNADMFCIEKHDSEIGCNGILFNSVFEPPMLELADELQFQHLLEMMCKEIDSHDVGSVDMLESYLKQFLVLAVRIKKATMGAQDISSKCIEHMKIQELRTLIDQHYKEERKLGFYAGKLHLSESGLHKLMGKYLDKTFTELMYDKLLIDAKKQLFTTNHSVKEISYDLGFNDPAYFSRFFKKQCTITPEQYRRVIRNSAAMV